MDLVQLALISFGNFLALIFHWQLGLGRQWLGKTYTIDWGGRYRVFRESVSTKPAKGEVVILVVVFRLKLIGSNPIAHWLFQRLCILTTPFWSGCDGFHIKLWMVDRATKNYAGIYSWHGREQALKYVTALERVLRAVSTPDSVKWQIIADHQFGDYLQSRQA